MSFNVLTSFTSPLSLSPTVVCNDSTSCTRPDVLPPTVVFKSDTSFTSPLLLSPTTSLIPVPAVSTSVIDCDTSFTSPLLLSPTTAIRPVSGASTSFCNWSISFSALVIRVLRLFVPGVSSPTTSHKSEIDCVFVSTARHNAVAGSLPDEGVPTVVSKLETLVESGTAGGSEILSSTPAFSLIQFNLYFNVSSSGTVIS